MIPYQEPVSKSDGPDVSSTMSQTLPMAAIFMRNRYVGWYGVNSASLALVVLPRAASTQSS